MIEVDSQMADSQRGEFPSGSCLLIVTSEVKPLLS
jgi:hypothetical protein